MSVKDHARYYLVDNYGEGGLVCELDRVDMVDQPTLIIGLGGTGADAMLNAKYVVHRKFKYEVGKTKPDRIAFLAIDTDADDLTKKRVGDVSIEKDECCDITEPSIKSFMGNHDLITDDWEKDWLSNGITPSTNKNGAGGIRQYGRFMAIHGSSKILTAVQHIVSNLYAAKKSNGAGMTTSDTLNVYIMAGISGGTGSGTFLDVAYMLREYIEVQLGKKVCMRSLIYMPDVNLCKVQIQEVRDYIPINGYAALMELDFWMNEERGRHFKQRYSNSLIVDTNKAPYEQCFIISPNGSTASDYDNCMKTSGEALLNILTKADPNAQVQGFESFLINLSSMLPNIKKTYAANYCYLSMGAAERRMQKDQITNYLAYYLLKQVKELFNREPTAQEIKSFINQKLKLDEKGMRKVFDEGLSVKPYPGVRDYDGFREAIRSYNTGDVLDGNLLEDELSVWVQACDSYYQMNKPQICKKYLEIIHTEVETLFRNQSYGPYYAHKMLYNGAIDSMYLIKHLNELILNLQTNMNSTAEQRETLEKIMRKDKETAQKHRLIPAIGSADYKVYVEAVWKLYDFDRYVYFLKQALLTAMTVRDEVVEYNNLIVERFVELLNELTEVFKHNSDIITSITTTGNTHTWNICDFAKIKPIVDSALKDLEVQGKTQYLVSEFLDWIIDERTRGEWLEDNGDLGKSFSEFINKKFSEILETTMEDHVAKVYALNSEQELQDFTENLAGQLRVDAKELYEANDTLCPIDYAVRRSLVSYPRIATNMGKGIESYVKKHHDLAADVVPTMSSGSLFWIEVVSGVPLYAFSLMPNYAQKYLQRGITDHQLGRHLKMGVDENWAELIPQLLPESVWGFVQYSNPERHEINEHILKVFDKGWNYGLFHPLSAGAGRYELAEVDEADYNEMLKKAPLTEQEINALMEKGEGAAADIRTNVGLASSYLTAAKAFMQDNWNINSKKLFKSDAFTKLRNGDSVDESAGPNRERQLLGENLLWTPDMAEALEAQVVLKDQLQRVIDAHELYAATGDAEKKSRTDFTKALFYGLYKPLAGGVFQLDTTGFKMQTQVIMARDDYRVAPDERYYCMFRKFQVLDPELKQTMSRMVEQRDLEMNSQLNSGNAELLQQYSEGLDKIREEVRERLNAARMDVTFDNSNVIEFYQGFLDECHLLLDL